jgi:hypothetical protein
MKPFNLQEAIAGKPIQTRDGRVLKFVAHVPEAREGYKVIIMKGDGYIGCWREDGKYLKDEEGDGDIVMATVVKTYWGNVYKSESGELFFGILFDNEADAMRYVDRVDGHIKTISFEIEE